MESLCRCLLERVGVSVSRRRLALVLGLAVLTVAGGCRAKAPRIDERGGHTLSGIASWYGKEFHGRPTSSGAIYDMYDMTAAHRTLPFGTMVEVKSLNNGKHIVVEVNDRGPFVKGRIIDLSFEAARQLDIVETGTASVALRVLLWGDRAKKETKYLVQVGSFSSWTNARRLQMQLQHEYPDVIIQPWVAPQGRFYRVRVGPYLTLRDAEVATGHLEDRGLTTFLVRD